MVVNSVAVRVFGDVLNLLTQYCSHVSDANTVQVRLQALAFRFIFVAQKLFSYALCTCHIRDLTAGRAYPDFGRHSFTEPACIIHKQYTFQNQCTTYTAQTCSYCWLSCCTSPAGSTAAVIFAVVLTVDNDLHFQLLPNRSKQCCLLHARLPSLGATACFSIRFVCMSCPSS